MTRVFGRVSDDPDCANTEDSYPAELVGQRIVGPHGDPVTVAEAELCGGDTLMLTFAEQCPAMDQCMGIYPFATRFELVPSLCSKCGELESRHTTIVRGPDGWACYLDGAVPDPDDELASS